MDSKPEPGAQLNTYGIGGSFSSVEFEAEGGAGDEVESELFP